MERNRKTDAEVAAAIGAAHRKVVWRYRKGVQIPTPQFMGRLYLFTAGAVTPNDFYDLPALPMAQADE